MIDCETTRAAARIRTASECERPANDSGIACCLALLPRIDDPELSIAIAGIASRRPRRDAWPRFVNRRRTRRGKVGETRLEAPIRTGSTPAWRWSRSGSRTCRRRPVGRSTSGSSSSGRGVRQTECRASRLVEVEARPRDELGLLARESARTAGAKTTIPRSTSASALVYVDEMFAGKKAGLWPLYEQLLALGLRWGRT